MGKEKGTNLYCALLDSHQLISGGLQHLLATLIPAAKVKTYKTAVELKLDATSENQRPDLVIVPHYTPGFAPIETVRTLRICRLSRTIAILATINSRFDQQTAFNAGADFYWDQYTKPETILEAVDQHCMQSSGSDRSLTSLTKRQTQVLSLAAKGFSNKEIARSLTISPETVKSHLKQVYSRFSVTNRVEAVQYVRDLNPS